MTSDRAPELAQQLVARADELLHEPIELVDGVPSGRHVGKSVRHGGWLTHPAAAVFLIVIVVATITEAVVAALGDRSPEPAGLGRSCCA